MIIEAAKNGFHQCFIQFDFKKTAVEQESSERNV